MVLLYSTVSPFGTNCTRTAIHCSYHFDSGGDLVGGHGIVPVTVMSMART